MSNRNKLPDMLTKEQLVKLFENMIIPKCSIACFMALMCGLRVREACRLEVLDIIDKTKEKIDEFARIQDRIFNSCGMPIRFKIALNQASRRSGESLSSAKYKQMEVNGLKSIIGDLKERIEETVKVSSYFDGGIHVKFNRVGTIINSKELLNEVAILLSKYNLVFFSYDLGGLEYGGN
jgi:hypothetical protein